VHPITGKPELLGMTESKTKFVKQSGEVCCLRIISLMLLITNTYTKMFIRIKKLVVKKLIRRIT
jgi:hypothetical protein